ncbi:MAG: pseudouridine synthase [Betaproteobacteria bacterium]
MQVVCIMQVWKLLLASAKDSMTIEGDANTAAGQALEAELPLACSGLRLDQALARVFPQYSRSRLLHWLRAGQVWLDEQPELEPRRRIVGRERVRVVVAALPGATAPAAEAIPLNIVFEDEHMIVLDKPAGLVVHPGSGNWTGTLVNALIHHRPASASLPRAGIVHRLDKDTTGLMVVAKSEVAHLELVRRLAAREVVREYLALVHGHVDSGGVVDAAIGRHPSQRTRMAVRLHGGKPAVTHYTPIQAYAACSLLRCKLDTGRTHQIRVHMAATGHPLVGDQTYGRRGAEPAFHRQALHAVRLGLTHPVEDREMCWECPLPSDIAELLAGLSKPTRMVKS